jgi:hypothetical protein
VLTIDQSARISEKMLPYKGTQFDMAIVSGDSEVTDLVSAIESALNSAGLKQINWEGGDVAIIRPGKATVGNVTISGVIIQMHPSHVQEISEAAAELAKALVGEGIAAKAEYDTGTAATNKNAMHILIGSKPRD